MTCFKKNIHACRARIHSFEKSSLSSSHFTTLHTLVRMQIVELTVKSFRARWSKCAMCVFVEWERKKLRKYIFSCAMQYCFVGIDSNGMKLAISSSKKRGIFEMISSTFNLIQMRLKSLHFRKQFDFKNSSNFWFIETNSAPFQTIPPVNGLDFKWTKTHCASLLDFQINFYLNFH